MEVTIKTENAKVYQLILRRNDVGEYVYHDFVRTDRNISEMKHEIRRNITQHQMDKKVEELVNGIAENSKITNRNVCAEIAWNEEHLLPFLLRFGVYKD